MKWRSDTAQLIAGKWVSSVYPGHGILGSVVRATLGSGEHGAAPLYDDWDSAADDSKEFRLLIERWPVNGTLTPAEDSVLSYVGTADYATGRLFVDGADLGTETISFFGGAPGAAAAVTDLTGAFTISAPVSADQAGSFLVFNAASADLTGAFDILGTSPQADLVGAFSVLGVAAADQAGAFTISAAVSADQAGTFAVSGAASADLAGAFDILGLNPQADLAGVFTISAAVSADLTGAFNVLATAAADLAGAFSVLGASPQADLAGAFTVSGSAAAELAGAFDIGENQPARPAEDGTKLWAAYPGGSLASCVDEPVADDSDHITSPDLVTPQVLILSKLTPAGAATVRFRARRTAAGGQIRVRMLSSADADVGGTDWQTLGLAFATFEFPVVLSAAATKCRIEIQP